MSTLTHVLNNGSKIPWIAFGTGTALYSQSAEEAVSLALSAGFRHVDGAQMYRNEDSLGAALNSFPRESIWVTTKLDKLPAGETVRESLKKSLQRLGVDYVDLWLIHDPTSHPGKLKQIWKEFEEVHKEGLAKNIGVSNFSIKQLEEILETATVVPQVNQIEFHPYLLKKTQPLLDFQHKHGIATQSYGGLSPIQAARCPDGPVTPVLKNVTEAVSKRRGKPVTEAQILIKWQQKKQVIIVTTSYKEARMKEYLDAFDVPELTDEEVQAIDRAGSELHYRRTMRFMDD